MASLNSNQQRMNQKNGKEFAVNIAGDFTDKGIDIESNQPYIDRNEIRPNGGGGVQFEDQLPPSDREGQNQDFTQSDTRRNAQAAANATTESLKSAGSQSALGQEAGKQLVNPAVNFPVDE